MKLFIWPAKSEIQTSILKVRDRTFDGQNAGRDHDFRIQRHRITPSIHLRPHPGHSGIRRARLAPWQQARQALPSPPSLRGNRAMRAGIILAIPRLCAPVSKRGPMWARLERSPRPFSGVSAVSGLLPETPENDQGDRPRRAHMGPHFETGAQSAKIFRTYRRL